MYPQEELRFLGARKAQLRQRIYERRVECAVAFRQVAVPIAWLDRAWAKWRRLSPLLKLAAVPLAMLLKRWIAPRKRVFGSILRWAPLAYGAVRGLTAARKLSRRS